MGLKLYSYTSSTAQNLKTGESLATNSLALVCAWRSDSSPSVEILVHGVSHMSDGRKAFPAEPTFETSQLGLVTCSGQHVTACGSSGVSQA